jgi:hypothetical protein
MIARHSRKSKQQEPPAGATASEHELAITI